MAHNGSIESMNILITIIILIVGNFGTIHLANKEIAHYLRR
jgi:uncharacterized protein YneF (UPF0154 family)